MTRWIDLWRELSRKDKRTATDAFFHPEIVQSEEGMQAIAFLAETLRFRVPKLVRLPPERLSQYLAKARAPWDPVIEAVLRALHLRERKPMLIRFLDALGVEHSDGTFDGSDATAPTVEAMQTAVRITVKDHASERVRLYLQCLLLQDGEFWAAAGEIDADALVRTPPTERERESEASEDPVDGADPTFRAGRTFDTLDQVLIDRVVESVGGIDGALPADRLRDLIDTVLHLNRDRKSAYFHLGFLDVMEQVEPSIDLPEINDDRRRWYLCGALAGFVRRTALPEARALVAEHARDFQVIGHGDHDGVSCAAHPLFRVFASPDDPAAFLEFVSARGLAAGGPQLVDKVTELAVDLLRDGRAEETRPLLDLSLAAIQVLEQQGRPAPPEYVRNIVRRRAHCHRMCGQLDDAREALEFLLDGRCDEHEGMIRTDLGLIACDLRELEDVHLPADPDNYAALAERLKPGLPYFEAAMACEEKRGGHGEFCLGVHHLASGNADEAVPLLERAVAEMQRRPNVYDRNGLLSRARLYLAYGFAQVLKTGRAEDVVRLVGQSVSRIGLPSEGMLRDIMVGLSAMNANQAKILATKLSEGHDNKLLRAIGDAELLRYFPEARRALLARGDEVTRDTADRLEDYKRVFQSACRANDTDAAEVALDRLEGLAETKDAARTVLDFLMDDVAETTVWSVDELDFAQVRIMEQLGRIQDARTVLARIAYRWVAKHDAFYVAEAAALVDRVRELGLAPSEALVRRVAGAQAEDPLAADDAARDGDARGRVFFIGGDERQAGYDESIRAWAQAEWPGVELELEHPGWGSNWHKQLESWEHRLRRADVVVLMPYVRTTLGRHCRRRCSQLGIRWVPCTSTGESGVRRSIARAVAWLKRAPAR